MAILVDGYNLLYAAGIVGDGAQGATLARSRRRLLNLLATVLNEAEAKATTVVFDAKDAPPGLPHEMDAWTNRRAVRQGIRRGGRLDRRTDSAQSRTAKTGSGLKRSTYQARGPAAASPSNRQRGLDDGTRRPLPSRRRCGHPGITTRAASNGKQFHGSPSLTISTFSDFLPKSPGNSTTTILSSPAQARRLPTPPKAMRRKSNWTRPFRPAMQLSYSRTKTTNSRHRPEASSFASFAWGNLGLEKMGH